jgi:hypothetical protein
VRFPARGIPKQSIQVSDFLVALAGSITITCTKVIIAG